MERGDFYEDDEPIEDVVEAFESGQPVVTGKAKPEVRRAVAMLSTRATPDEAELIRQAAQRHGLSVSAYLRQCALEQAAQPVVKVVVPLVDQPGFARSIAANLNMLGPLIAIAGGSCGYELGPPSH